MNSFEGDRVRIELSRDEFELLLMALGAALATPALPNPFNAAAYQPHQRGKPEFYAV